MNDDLSPLFEADGNQIIQPNSVPAHLIPEEIWSFDDPTPRVYRVLLGLALQGEGETVKMPPRDEMARLCRTNRTYLNESYMQLHNSGWITIQNLNQTGRKERFSATVKYIVNEAIIRQSTRASQLMENFEEKVVQIVERINGKNVQAGLHKIESVNLSASTASFPPSLHALKSICTNKDAYGNTLASYSDQLLFDLSGQASYQQIEYAIMEVEAFRPKNKKPIENIGRVFRSRFVFDKEWRGKLNPKREVKFDKEKPSDHVKQTFQQRAQELQASIYPDDFHDVKCVDRHCDELNLGGSVIRGETCQAIRKLFLETAIITKHPQHGDGRLILAQGFTLSKIDSGFWKVEKCHAHATFSDSKRSTTGEPSAISRVLENLQFKSASNS